MTDDELLRALEDDPRVSADAAGLRYVADDEPGFTRRRCGRGFSYRDWRGRTVRDEASRTRFAELAIPPAWRDVWICRYRDGHLQATGRDAEGRKQYVYHPSFREAREESKYARMIPFAHLLPRIRERVEADLAREGLQREKVLAAVVRLLESSRARVGNDAYVRQNDSYGVTTIRKRHVGGDSGDGELLLEFNGKGGKPWRIEVADPRLVEVVVECLETPGWELFKYFDAEGTKRRVDADDVNEYLETIAAAPVTAKDFRTWAGTVAAVTALEEEGPHESEEDCRRKISCAIERVAEEMGNTPAVCRECYVHPQILARYEAGELLGSLGEDRYGDASIAGLSPHEAVVLRLLTALS